MPLLTHPTHEALNALKLDGMAEAFDASIRRAPSRAISVSGSSTDPG